MKKTIKIIAILIVALIILTGCSVNVNYEVKVNKDGSGDISYVYGFSKDTLESLQTSAEDLVANMKTQAEESEYTTEYYEDDSIAGFKATKHLNDISKEFSLKEAFGQEYVKEDENKKGVIITKNLFKTKIIQESEIDLTSMKDIQTVVDMKYTVKLPVKIKTNNATELDKDGKTATWNLTPGEVNKIEYTASGINILPIIIIIIAVLVALALVYYFIIFKKKKDVTK